MNLPNNEHDVTIGDEVELIEKSEYKSLRGIVRFIGEIRSLRHCTDKYFGNVYFGIELYSNNSKANDGSINGQRYFSCAIGHGIFVKRDKIFKITNINYDVARITVNDTIFIPKYKCNGIVKFIGIPDFEYNQYINPMIYYGIELEKPFGDNNGIINNRYYFDYCIQDHGVFINQYQMSYLKISSRDCLLVCGYSSLLIPNGICKLIKSYIDDIYIELSSFQYDIVEPDGVKRKFNIIRKSRYEVYDISGNLVGPIIYVYDGSSGRYMTEISGLYQFSSIAIQEITNNKWTIIKTTPSDKYKEKKNGIRRDILNLYNTTWDGLLKAFKENDISMYGQLNQ